MRARRWLGAVLLLAALAAAAAGYLYYRLEHPSRAGEPSAVTILFQPGTSTSQIFHKLAETGVVPDGRLAEVYYRLYRSRTRLQAGEYRFDRPMPIDDVINRMAHGEVVKNQYRWEQVVV